MDDNIKTSYRVVLVDEVDRGAEYLGYFPKPGQSIEVRLAFERIQRKVLAVKIPEKGLEGNPEIWVKYDNSPKRRR